MLTSAAHIIQRGYFFPSDSKNGSTIFFCSNRFCSTEEKVAIKKDLCIKK